jgi:hypothetical protein
VVARFVFLAHRAGVVDRQLIERLAAANNYRRAEGTQLRSSRLLGAWPWLALFLALIPALG